MVQAVVLAGGLGTRLRSILSDRPKPLAPVLGRPFLDHLLMKLHRGGVGEVVLCVSYMAEKIMQHVGDRARSGLKIKYSIEPEPYDTGGAVKNALALLQERFLVLNGDTWLEIDYLDLLNYHGRKGATVTMALVQAGDEARYGSATVDEEGRVTSFKEKEGGSSLVNGGVYAFEKESVPWESMPRKFSLERQMLPMLVSTGRLFGYPTTGYFRDIGSPEDYLRFEQELKAKGSWID